MKRHPAGLILAGSVIFCVCGCTRRDRATPPEFRVESEAGALPSAGGEQGADASPNAATEPTLSSDASSPSSPLRDAGGVPPVEIEGGAAESSSSRDGTDPLPDTTTDTSSAVIDGCYSNPRSHLEIINACTTAVIIVKTPNLVGLNPDGSLPPLP